MALRSGRPGSATSEYSQLGIAKNKNTKLNYKKSVRIAKNMREEMVKYEYQLSDKISSFGIESLLWNVDDSVYTKYSSILRYTFDEILCFLVNNFSAFEVYTEANAIKPLFSDLSSKLAYQKFVADMHQFFEYDI